MTSRERATRRIRLKSTVSEGTGENARSLAFSMENVERCALASIRGARSRGRMSLPRAEYVDISFALFFTRPDIISDTVKARVVAEMLIH